MVRERKDQNRIFIFDSNTDIFFNPEYILMLKYDKAFNNSNQLGFN